MTLFVPAYNPVTRASLREAHANYRANQDTPDGYDIFLIAGQSNCYNGNCSTGDTCPNPTLDSTDTDIQQWGRFDGENNTVILAEEPLDHIGYLGNRPPSNLVGWALAFAKAYKAQGFLLGNRKVLLVPVAEGGSGFADNKWNKGDADYTDAVTRTLAALATGSGTNVIKGILWHQGEDDSGNSTLAANHATAFPQMIDDMRTDLGDANLPFIAGGLLPSSWQYLSVQTVQDTIEGIVTAKTYTGYADPLYPTELTSVGTESVSNNHYSSYSMRGSSQDFTDNSTIGMAGRYMTAYQQALTNY